MRPFHSLLLALALVAAAAAYAWLDADAGVSTWRSLHREVAEAQARVRALESSNAALRAEAGALRTDPFAKERAVREELRWVRPGEVLVRVPRADAPEAAGALP